MASFQIVDVTGPLLLLIALAVFVKTFQQTPAGFGIASEDKLAHLRSRGGGIVVIAFGNGNLAMHHPVYISKYRRIQRSLIQRESTSVAGSDWSAACKYSANASRITFGRPFRSCLTAYAPTISQEDKRLRQFVSLIRGH